MCVCVNGEKKLRFLEKETEREQVAIEECFDFQDFVSFCVVYLFGVLTGNLFNYLYFVVDGKLEGMMEDNELNDNRMLQHGGMC